MFMGVFSWLLRSDQLLRDDLGDGSKRLAAHARAWHLLIMADPHPDLATGRRCSADDAPAGESAETPAPSGRSPLFGDVRALGFSFEWHDYWTKEELDWSRDFEQGRLELCLNLDGQATLAEAKQTVELGPRSSTYFFQGDPPLTARRHANERHRFLKVNYAPSFLRLHLDGKKTHLRPCVDKVIRRPPRESMLSIPEPMSIALLHVTESLRRCPVSKLAQETWFRCKALELAAHALFRPVEDEDEDEGYCERRHCVACARASQVRDILRERLTDPPSLKELGKLVGCSPFYLSRQFSRATGLTIQQFLRQARLERAAELLRAGSHNVTEAAMEVGYNSLSHFTVAFREAFGCCPGLFPVKTIPASSAPTARGSGAARA